jgi:hypothetical protein
MFTTMRGVAASLVVALAILTASTGVVVAGSGSVEEFHDRFDFTLDAFDLCGIPVAGEFHGFSNVVIKDGNELRALHRHFTWTSLVNGNVLEFFSTGVSRGLSVTDNGDGTITSVTAVSGTQRIYDSSGVKAVATGRIVFADTIDVGDPNDPEDDAVVSSQVLSVAGPHSDTPFCDVVTDALL